MTALGVAKQILSRFNESGDEIGNLKLQKLLYFALGWSLALENVLLFNDTVEARTFGPYFPAVGERYRNHSVLAEDMCHPKPIIANSIIDAVVEVYGSMMDKNLVAKTHREAPWFDNYSDDDSTPALIPTEDIKRYFSSQLVKQDSRMHSQFLGVFLDRKYEIVLVKVPTMSAEELADARREFGLD